MLYNHLLVLTIISYGVCKMDLSSIIKRQRDYFNRNETKDVAFRKKNLERLQEAIIENEPAIYAALKADLGKSEFESYTTEVSQVKNAIKYAIKNIEKWNKPRKVRTPIALFPGKSIIEREPYGVVLVMAPWNYPLNLSLTPVIGAIAAGNCVVIKMSKSSPNTSGVVVDIINSTFSKNYVYAIEEVISYDEILEQRYDYIFFTGSERVGKNIMRIASENLTPITLELGGKSPCIVDHTANISLTAKKIMWGKLLNAGQTCVAPDYVLVHKTVKDKLVEELRRNAKEMIGDPFTNDDYPHIISLHHFMRLKNLIGKEEIVIGGRCDDKLLRIEPTILPNATYESAAMKAEIFGPVLPIIEYEDVEEMVAILKTKPKSLACYIFSDSKGFVSYIKQNVSFGGGCVNDCIMHLANEELPFGGVGSSGMGCYHGKASFDTFSREKSIYHAGSKMDLKFKYPPYKKNTLKMIKKIY